MIYIRTSYMIPLDSEFVNMTYVHFTLPSHPCRLILSEASCSFAGLCLAQSASNELRSILVNLAQKAPTGKELRFRAFLKCVGSCPTGHGV
jgi:hypothetical protein